MYLVVDAGWSQLVSTMANATTGIPNLRASAIATVVLTLYVDDEDSAGKLARFFDRSEFTVELALPGHRQAICPCESVPAFC